MRRPYVSMLVFGPRLIAIVSALAMTHGLPASAQGAYDVGQLQEIERFITQRDCIGLSAYVRSNPHLVRGEDPLAKELSRFIERTQRGPIDCFGSSPPEGQLTTSPPRGLFGIGLGQNVAHY